MTRRFRARLSFFVVVIYLPFGVQTAIAPNDTNPFRWGGMYWDGHRGEYMTPNRMFNPRTGRWTQPDPFFHMRFGSERIMGSPAAIAQSGNLFMFALHNPIIWNDPTGLFVIPALDALREAKARAAEASRRAAGDFIGGVASGFTAYFQNAWNSVTNAVNNPVGTATNFASSQINSLITNPHATVMQFSPQGLMMRSIQQGAADLQIVLRYGFYGYGTIVGRTAAEGTIILTCYAAGKVLGVISSAFTAPKATSINNILSNARHTNTTNTGVMNFRSSSSGMNAAVRDFNSLNPTNVRHVNGRTIGDLPGGTVVNIHPSAHAGGVPTLEIYNRSLNMQIKIRY